MTTEAPGRPRGALAFNRLAVIILIIAAAVPVLVLGGLVFLQVDRALARDAVERTERAFETTEAVVEQAARDLEALTRSYAEWPVFAGMTAASDLESIRTDVLEFLVERGTVAAGVVDAPSARVAAGEPEVTDALASILGNGGTTPRVITIGRALYLVDDRAVGPGDATGPTIGRILLARRLDAAFAADIRQLTGFETALLDSSGDVAVSTDLATTDLALGGGSTATSRSVVRLGDIVTSRRQLGATPSGGSVVLATRVSALQATAGGLPMLVLGLLAMTIGLAGALGIVLARVLGGRLRVIHDGLAAIADGRVPPPGAGRGDDDIARLAAGLDRLVETLDRRETSLRRCLAAAAAVPATATLSEAARLLAAATDDILGTAWCRVIAPNGAVVVDTHRRDPGAGSPDPDEAAADDVQERIIDAPMALEPEGMRLEASVPDGRDWTDGDQAAFEVMALLAGTVLREAEQYSLALSRADRLHRRNRLQKEFLRGISHNLLAPLATIELAASDLAETGGVDPFVQARAVAIQLEERRLTRLVNQVLILTRIETRMLQLDGAPVALVALVRRVAAELDIGDLVSITDTTGGELAFADPAASEQVVWVILDNAIRYAGLRPINVEVGLAGAADPTLCPWVQLAIEDEGPGVAPAERRSIFRQFVRGSGTTHVGGTGLGLSVARGLARAMGGDVSCRAGAVGARFEVSFPRAGLGTAAAGAAWVEDEPAARAG